MDSESMSNQLESFERAAHQYFYTEQSILDNLEKNQDEMDFNKTMLPILKEHPDKEKTLTPSEL